MLHLFILYLCYIVFLLICEWQLLSIDTSHKRQKLGQPITIYPKSELPVWYWTKLNTQKHEISQGYKGHVAPTWALLYMAQVSRVIVLVFWCYGQDPVKLNKILISQQSQQAYFLWRHFLKEKKSLNLEYNVLPSRPIHHTVEISSGSLER